MRVIAFIFFLLFIVKTQGKAQQYNYNQYDVRDGLSGNTVYAIAQDKDRFLWFGTETGLSRFDGSNFKNFTTTDGLYDNEIINLFVDSRNRVWIFPFKNALYYYYQGKIHNSSNDSLIRKFNLENELYGATEDKYGNIFFLGQRKVFILSVNNDLREIDKIDNINFYTNACGVSSNGNCNLYIVSRISMNNNREYIYEYKNNQFVLKKSLQDSNYSKNAFEINAHYKVIKNGLFLQVFDQDDNYVFNIAAPDHFHTISYINDSCFAISTFNKTFLYNINKRKIVDSFLNNKVCNKCFNDKENNLWFATATNGVFRLSSTKVKIYRNESEAYMPVYAIDYFNKILYIGSEKNILRTLNLYSNELKTINIKTINSISYISNIQVKNSKNVLVGSNAGLFHVGENKISALLYDFSIKSVALNNNSVVAATDRAVFDISLSDYKIQHKIWNSRATCAYKTANNYYIGTLNGLYILKKDTSYAALKDKIVDIKADSSKNLWIATENNGLVCMKNDKVIYQLTIKDGLTSNLCKCLYVSGKNIWVGTDKGINKVDVSYKPFTITNFTAADGLDCEIINCIYASGDSVFAGTPYGITFFDAGTIQNESVCNLKLLNIQSKKANWYFNQDSVHLSSDDNFLRFEYAGISFISAGDITYYYRLKGLSNSWDSTMLNEVEFQSIRPGKYEFEIYAVNKDNVKSRTITVAFTKAKPFWQLLWVQFILVIALGALLWLAITARINAVRKKEHEKLLRERKINELEQMALRAQMNPHFIFNSLNSIQQYVFAGDVMEANEFITNFSSLVRQTLYMSGKKFITLAEEINYLESYLTLEQAKYENSFKFQIISGENIAGNTPVPSLLIQPFIENSIRHGILNLKMALGKIMVHFFEENNFLFCVVEDNGIGRENAMRLKMKTNFGHQSKGMELVQKRIENLNSIYNCEITVSIEDIVEEDTTGTRVIVKLPLHYDE